MLQSTRKIVFPVRQPPDFFCFVRRKYDRISEKVTIWIGESCSVSSEIRRKATLFHTKNCADMQKFGENLPESLAKRLQTWYNSICTVTTAVRGQPLLTEMMSAVRPCL